MVTHMKTTVEISDPLLATAKQIANRDQTTLRTLIEEGLRLVVQSRRHTPAFHLRDASCSGDGLQPDIHEGDWDTIRAMIYEGHGG